MVVDEDMVDVLDPDLDLLAVGNNDNVVGQSAEREISIGDDFEIAFNADQKEDNLSLDEDDLAIDTSRFADVPINMQAVQETQPVQFAIPEGLADISDLARPAAGAESKSELAVHLGDDDLNLDDLNLSLGGEKASIAVSSAVDDELALLSLDDIDLSGGLEVAPLSPPAPLPSRPVDDDLNFDLDLGTLGEEKDRPQKKELDDLPELTLSLE
ncbi:MAG: hypothetical protein NTY00_00725 [Deltaproteobacteria bacterium]|nr:hypothetical protein [Deltaproteobacteria bacterium]